MCCHVTLNLQSPSHEFKEARPKVRSIVLARITRIKHQSLFLKIVFQGVPNTDAGPMTIKCGAKTHSSIPMTDIFASVLSQQLLHASQNTQETCHVCNLYAVSDLSDHSCMCSSFHSHDGGQ